jgi:hypothetical protein
MLNNISRLRLIGAWCALVLVIAAGGVVMGVPMTLATIGWLLAIALIPPVVMLFVWRGAPPPTVAELLHSVNGPSKGARP